MRSHPTDKGILCPQDLFCSQDVAIHGRLKCRSVSASETADVNRLRMRPDSGRVLFETLKNNRVPTQWAAVGYTDASDKSISEWHAIAEENDWSVDFEAADFELVHGPIENENALAVEQAARIAADAAEETARIAADSAATTARGIIQTDVDSVEAAALSGRNAIVATATTLRSEYDVEKVATAAARTAIVATATTLRSEYDAEKVATSAGRATLQTNIDTENARIDVITASQNLASLKALEDDYSGKFNTLFDSGTTLDQISELKTAWEGGDGTLQSAIDGLTTSASAARTVIQNDVDANEAAALSGRNAIIATATTLASTVALKRNIADSYTKTQVDAAQGTQDSAIALNTAKVGISTAQASQIVANNSKVTYDAQSAVSANTAKVGISTAQASQIVANNGKVTYDAQSAVSANSAKVGISSQQAADIVANNAKVSYSDASTVSSHATLHTQHTAALATKSATDDPAFTTKIAAPLVHTPQIMSQNAHLKIGSAHTNDLNIFLNNAETLQIVKSGTEVRYQSHGGSGTHRFMNKVYGNDDVSIAGTYQVNGTNIFSGCVLTGNPTAPTQSAGDNSTKIATTAYADAAGGSSSITVLSQRNDSGSAISYTGEGPSTTARQLAVSETEVITYFESNSNAGHAWVRLPLLSAVSAGDKYTIRNFFKDYGTWISPHATDSGNGHSIRMGWSWSHNSPNHVFASKDRRVVECIVLQNISGSKQWICFKHETSRVATN